MPSKAYLEAKKEFINCLAMSIIGLGVPVVIAFREWWPIMKAEKAKEKAIHPTVENTAPGSWSLSFSLLSGTKV